MNQDVHHQLKEGAKRCGWDMEVPIADVAIYVAIYVATFRN
jgi:hypothetical protein